MKSQYDPHTSSINFAVPNEKILTDFNRTLPKLILPGKIEVSLWMMSDKKYLIIMGDGKLVTKGLGENFTGDVNLFGHQVSPNLMELKEDLKIKLRFISQCASKYFEAKHDDKIDMVEELLDLVTHMTRDIRLFHMNESKKLKRYELRESNLKFLDKAISKCKTNMYTAVVWCKNTMKLNCNLGKIMASLQENNYIYKTTDRAELTELENVRLLHECDYVSANLQPHDSPHLIRKYTEMWMDLKSESFIRDDTAYSALGLNGIKKL